MTKVLKNPRWDQINPANKNRYKQDWNNSQTNVNPFVFFSLSLLKTSFIQKLEQFIMGEKEINSYTNEQANASKSRGPLTIVYILKSRRRKKDKLVPSVLQNIQRERERERTNPGE